MFLNGEIFKKVVDSFAFFLYKVLCVMLFNVFESFMILESYNGKIPHN